MPPRHPTHRRLLTPHVGEGGSHANQFSESLKTDWCPTLQLTLRMAKEIKGDEAEHLITLQAPVQIEDVTVVNITASNTARPSP